MYQKKPFPSGVDSSEALLDPKVQMLENFFSGSTS